MGKYNDVICKSETIADEIACLAKSMGAADTGIIPISDYANNILSYENRSFLSMVENRDINGLLRLGGEIAEIMREFRIVEIIATIPVEE